MIFEEFVEEVVQEFGEQHPVGQYVLALASWLDSMPFDIDDVLGADVGEPE